MPACLDRASACLLIQNYFFEKLCVCVCVTSSSDFHTIFVRTFNDACVLVSSSKNSFPLVCVCSVYRMLFSHRLFAYSFLSHFIFGKCLNYTVAMLSLSRRFLCHSIFHAFTPLVRCYFFICQPSSQHIAMHDDICIVFCAVYLYILIFFFIQNLQLFFVCLTDIPKCVQHFSFAAFLLSRCWRYHRKVHSKPWSVA